MAICDMDFEMQFDIINEIIWQSNIIIIHFAFLDNMPSYKTSMVLENATFSVTKSPSLT